MHFSNLRNYRTHSYVASHWFSPVSACNNWSPVGPDCVSNALSAFSNALYNNPALLWYQQRKRARVEELRTGKDGYLTSPEFQKSILLFGCGDSCSVNGAAKSIVISGPGNKGGDMDSASSIHRNVVGTGTGARLCDSSAAAAVNGSAGGAASSSSAAPLRAATTGTASMNNSSSGHSALVNRSSTAPVSASAKQNQIVDLTCDSSPDQTPVRALPPRSVPSSSSDAKWGAWNDVRTSVLAPIAGTTTGANSSTKPTVFTAPQLTPPVAPAPVPTQAEVDLSRSRVVYHLAQLLDDVAVLVGTNNSNSNSGVGGSSSSSASSSSSSSAQKYAVYDTSKLYEENAERLISVMQQLRPVVARLLLLEVNAIKFYPKVSFPYLCYLARKVDHKLACGSVLEARLQLQAAIDCVDNGSGDDKLATQNGVATAASAAPVVEPCVLSFSAAEDRAEPMNLATTQVVNTLTKECNRLERGLYKLPTDGNMVPAILRKPKLGCFERALASRIETDGIEIVDTGSAVTAASSNSVSTAVSTSGAGAAKVGISEGSAKQPITAAVLMDSDAHYFSCSEESVWSQPSSYHSSDSE
jgi:hypothetical protein